MMAESDDVRRVTEEIRGRLASKGIRFDDRTRSEDLVRVEEAVEEFESAVESRGGDLMMDEGQGKKASQPDDRRFALPASRPGERATDYLGRLALATSKVRQHKSK